MIYFTFYPYASALCLVYSGLPRLKFYGINLAKIFVLLRKPILLALHFKNTQQAPNFAAECTANVSLPPYLLL